MAITVEQFIERFTVSGLTSAAEIDTFQRRPLFCRRTALTAE
jgi:hypothetical protein